MAKVTRRKVEGEKEVWVADWYDFGKRKVKRFDTKREAADFLAGVVTAQRQRPTPTIDPHVTLAAFVPEFMTWSRGRDVRASTLERYRIALERHILPALGHVKVRELDRPKVARFLAQKRTEADSLQGQKGDKTEGRRVLSRGSVLHLLTTLGAILTAAVAYQLVVAHPLRGLVKELRLTRRKGEKIKAFDVEQLARLYAVAREEAPDALPALAVMGAAGLRLGEALALKWDHVDFGTARLYVREQLGGAPLKDGEERTVDMAADLSALLADTLRQRREAAFREGRTPSPYVTIPDFEKGTDAKARQRAIKLVSRRMARVLKLAGLPTHHTPHSLRHTFASVLISAGVSPAYVQRQLGHSSIALTVDLYGRWLPIAVPGAVDRLGACLTGASGDATGKEKPAIGKGANLAAALNLAEAASY